MNLSRQFRQHHRLLGRWKLSLQNRKKRQQRRLDLRKKVVVSSGYAIRSIRHRSNTKGFNQWQASDFLQVFYILVSRSGVVRNWKMNGWNDLAKPAQRGVAQYSFPRKLSSRALILTRICLLPSQPPPTCSCSEQGDSGATNEVVLQIYQPVSLSQKKPRTLTISAG